MVTDLIQSDFEKYNMLKSQRNLSACRIIWKFILSRGLMASTVYRLRHHVYKLPWSQRKVFYSVILSIADFCVRAAYGISIDKRAEIGRGLYLRHFGGMRIGPCRIGENCSIGHQTRILPHPNNSQVGWPVIGNNVWIGAHVTIVGSVSVESYSAVSSGALVKKDIPANVLVVGCPARVVSWNYDNTPLFFLPRF